MIDAYRLLPRACPLLAKSSPCLLKRGLGFSNVFPFLQTRFQSHSQASCDLQKLYLRGILPSTFLDFPAASTLKRLSTWFVLIFSHSNPSTRLGRSRAFPTSQLRTPTSDL